MAPERMTQRPLGVRIKAYCGAARHQLRAWEWKFLMLIIE